MLVVISLPIPGELHLDLAVFVAVDLFPRRADDVGFLLCLWPSAVGAGGVQGKVVAGGAALALAGKGFEGQGLFTGCFT